jgi:hypothetical protein
MGQLVFQAALGGAVNLIGPNISATTNFTLPGADGTNGQALTTNGSGTLGFSSIVSGAAGSNTQVQFNSGGNFGASSSLTWSGTILTSTGFAGPINGTIGATTANTGAFTTTTVSTSETLSYGTANGVTYLNGSKVLTSGSALTFDGTTLGVSASAPYVRSTSTSGSQTHGFTFYEAATQLGFMEIDKNVGSLRIGTSINWATVFYTNNAEQMRLTTTGLGIGTSSPAQKLQVEQNSANTTVRILRTGYGYTDLIGGTGGTGNDFKINMNGTDRMYVESSTGNVGIGTSSPAYKLDVFSGNTTGGRISFGGSTADSVIEQQRWTGSASNYYGTRITNASGAILFSNSDTTTIGAQTFTTRMTLDVSGNLGLGVTPSAWNSAYKALQFGTTGALFAESGDAAVYLTSNSFINSAGTNTYITTDFASRYNQENGVHKWLIAPSGTAGTAISFTQAMTLDASGRLLVGTTSGSGATMFTVNQPAASTDAKTIVSVATGTNAAFTAFVNTTVTTVGTENSSGGSLVSGSSAYSTVIANNGAYPISFGTNNTERARIDSSGNLLVGTTTASYLLTQGMVVKNPNDVETYVAVGHKTGSGNGSSFFIASYNGALIGNITQNGTTGVLYNITSDHRLKDVIGAVSGAGERIDALEPIEYTWKSDGSRTRGFLAHKFQEVYANSVTGTKDAVDAEGNPVYQSMQASTSEVIADLVAEIQSLRQRLSAANL